MTPTFSSPGGVEGADLALFLLILTVRREERVGAGEAVVGEAGGDSVSARGLFTRDLEPAGSFGVSGRESLSLIADSSTCR